MDERNDSEGNGRAAQNHLSANPQNDRKRRTPGRQSRPGVENSNRKHPFF